MVMMMLMIKVMMMMMMMIVHPRESAAPYFTSMRPHFLWEFFDGTFTQ